MNKPPPESHRQLGVFTRPQALASGWSRGALDSARQRGRVMSLRRGIYIDADALPNPADHHGRSLLAVLSVAAVLGEPGSAASHCSAAVLDGLSTLTVPERPCLTIGSRRHGTIDGVHLHRATHRAHSAVGADHIPRTSIARTVIDIARELGTDAGVVSADAALRDGRVSVQALDRVLAECAGWPGIQWAIKAVQLTDGRAESPLESISRLAISRAGLPEPTLQAEVFTIGGQWLGRTDFLWEEQGVVGEADGLDKYCTAAVLQDEKLRQERMEQAGLTVVRWGWGDALDPRRLSGRIGAAMARAARACPDERRWAVRVVQPSQRVAPGSGALAGQT